MGSVSDSVIGRWFTARYAAQSPEVVDAFRAEFERTDPAGYADCCAAIAEMDQRAILPAVRAPTLVLAGADDAATPPAHGEVIAAGIPGARLAVIPGAAHLAAVTAPAQVTAELHAHLYAATVPSGERRRWR